MMIHTKSLEVLDIGHGLSKRVFEKQGCVGYMQNKGEEAGDGDRVMRKRKNGEEAESEFLCETAAVTIR